MIFKTIEINRFLLRQFIYLFFILFSCAMYEFKSYGFGFSESLENNFSICCSPRIAFLRFAFLLLAKISFSSLIRI